MKSAAIVSPCKKYRYELSRIWREDIPPLVFVMLNPSLANADKNDPTVTRCMGRALNMGYGGLLVYNAYAAISPWPEKLLAMNDPVGPDNDVYLSAIRKDADIIVAWGSVIAKIGSRRRDEVVLKLLGRPVKALGVSKGSIGYPLHPLYISYKAEPIEYIRVDRRKHKPKAIPES